MPRSQTSDFHIKTTRPNKKTKRVSYEDDSDASSDENSTVIERDPQTKTDLSTGHDMSLVDQTSSDAPISSSGSKNSPNSDSSQPNSRSASIKASGDRFSRLSLVPQSQNALNSSVSQINQDVTDEDQELLTDYTVEQMLQFSYKNSFPKKAFEIGNS